MGLGWQPVHESIGTDGRNEPAIHPQPVPSCGVRMAELNRLVDSEDAPDSGSGVLLRPHRPSWQHSCRKQRGEGNEPRISAPADHVLPTESADMVPMDLTVPGPSV